LGMYDVDGMWDSVGPLSDGLQAKPAVMSCENNAQFEQYN